MKPIGELNGSWSVMFRLTQVLVPLLALTIIPWSVWVTNTLYSREVRISKIEAWMNLGPRFTADNAEALRFKMAVDVDSKIISSNERVLQRIESLALLIGELKLELTKHTVIDRSKP